MLFQPSLVESLVDRAKSSLTRVNFDPESMGVDKRSMAISSHVCVIFLDTSCRSDNLDFTGHFGFEFWVLGHLCEIRSNVKTADDNIGE